MKIAATIARYLSGLMFTVFGLNGFFHFIPQPPPTSEAALQYFTVLSTTHYIAIPFLFQLVAGILLLANRYVPLALAFLAPILVNILTYHATMDPGGIGLGVFATILWVVLFVRYQSAFRGIFEASPRVD